MISGTFSGPTTFATHSQLAGYGFQWGPSDGHFGAIASGGGNYTFYGTAAGSATCSGSPKLTGVFTFTGTLDHVTGSNGCKRLFGPGDGPAGWLFGRDYQGGGQVVRFSSGGKSGYLMVFHTEYHWPTPETSDHLCNKVPCFYSSLGLAISLDNGQTFQNVGEILQPVQPLSAFLGGSRNYGLGYGSLVVADANGQHLDNPPPDPSSAYFYVFFTDWDPSLPNLCSADFRNCTGVARAKYSDVVAAAIAGNPSQVATVFKKYDGGSPDAWTQPGTSNTPDLSGTSGTFAPLWSDAPGGDGVLYDQALNVYLVVTPPFADLTNNAVWLRASNDLLHWSEPFAVYTEPGRDPTYATLIGETGDPTIGGAAPRIYFSSFPAGSFPDWTMATFESVTLTLSTKPPPPLLQTGSLANGATYQQGGLVPGSWAEIKGFNLANVSRKWDASDFTGLGNNLPTNLSGTQVKVNGSPAAVYYVQPDQVNFQVPAGVSGTATVQVITNGIASNTATAAAAANSPGIFPIVQNGAAYAAAVFLDGKIAGDPSVNPVFRAAHPGDHIQLYATGLVPSPAGVLVSLQFLSGVTVALGNSVIPADAAALVTAGEFQINFTVPQQFASLPEGLYPISIQINGVSSPSYLDSNTSLQIVLPIKH